jgi:hypothetical protein
MQVVNVSLQMTVGFALPENAAHECIRNEKRMSA